VTETLLVTHILSAAAWIGGGFFNGFVGPRMAKAGGESALTWLRVVLDASLKFFLPAGIVTLLSGMLLVIVDDTYEWGDLFVGIGMAVVVIAVIVVFTVMVPSTRRALIAAEGGDFPNVGVNARRAALGGQVIAVLLVLTEIAMVIRLGV